MQAKRVDLHPDYKKGSIDFKYYSHAGALPTNAEVQRTDLAILEFPMDSVTAKNLESLGVHPATIYDGTGFKKPLIAAQIVGFGSFGTSQSGQLTNQNEYKVYSGYTRVTYGAYLGRVGFYHWSPFTADGLKLFDSDSLDASMNPDQFSLHPMAMEYFDPDSKTRVHVQSHPSQALFSGGDSGSPLFFQAANGLRVAGIASTSGASELINPSDRSEKMFIRQMWEPLKEQLPWIEDIQRGDRGSSLVWEVGRVGAKGALTLSSSSRDTAATGVTAKETAAEGAYP